ncbi:hypothetical protein [Burkholderia glumae]|uniref:hypothetical protein n=1 Tax=Burkholderia glumae TaxID=337 RepID=UPI002150FB70|nr:hypothetical protein [Burkholderia glumae]
MLFVASAAAASAAQAAEAKPDVLYSVKMVNGKWQKYVSALVNMDDRMTDSYDNCSQGFGLLKVEGVQFSASGATLESFRFTDSSGQQLSVPTNIGKLPNSVRVSANSFIRVGKQYFAEIQTCGSGGFPSLINLYDVTGALAY